MKIKLFIMRHGEAEIPHAMSPDRDFNRQLTERGIKDVRYMGNWFKGRSLKVLKYFVSPYKRAQQTYKEFSSVLPSNTKRVPITSDLITPLDDATIFHDYLDGLFSSELILEEGDGILIVSHMPFVSYLIESLTLGEQRPDFSTACIAEVIYDTQKMRGDLINITKAI